MSRPENPSGFPFDESMFPDISIDPATGNYRIGDEELAPTKELDFTVTPGLVYLINTHIEDYDKSLTQAVHKLLGYAGQMHTIERDSEEIVQRTKLGIEEPYLPDVILDEDVTLPEALRGVTWTRVAVTPGNLVALEAYMAETGYSKDEAVSDFLAKGSWLRRQLRDKQYTFEVRMKSGKFGIISSRE